MDAAPIVEQILGGSYEPAPEESELVRAHVEAAGMLAPGETFEAGVDETWTGSARRGAVITSRRLFRHRKGRARDIVEWEALATVRVRRMWYAGAPLLGRGESFGRGPVVILRFRFERRSGRAARLRLQDCAGTLHPFVSALAAHAGDDLVVARTLPGL